MLKCLQRFVDAKVHLLDDEGQRTKWAEEWASFDQDVDGSALQASETAGKLLRQVVESKARLLVICFTAQVIVAECHGNGSETAFSLEVCESVFHIGEVPSDDTAWHTWERESSESMV